MERKKEKLAEKVMQMTRQSLLIRYSFFARPLEKLQFVSGPDRTESVASDGTRIYYHPDYVTAAWEKGKNNLEWTLLHTVIHCLFQHQSGGLDQDIKRWDLACDLAVSWCLFLFAGDLCPVDKNIRQIREVLQEIESRTAHMTVAHIMDYLQDSEISDVKLEVWGMRFREDDHSVWNLSPQEGEGGKSSAQTVSAGDEEDISDIWQMEDWLELAKETFADMEKYLPKYGDYAGSRTQSVFPFSKDVKDYTSLLRQFMTEGEVLHACEEEFDYIFYTYGLGLYGNMPLIEPLEYRQEYYIRDLVIAIDTSGSTSGDMVQSFLQMTADILKNTDSFSAKVNLHIIQCDAEIQSDVRISTPGDMARYIHNVEIRGLGGTDFRPVFERVDDLVASGAFTDLSGLIYFTDGYGEFPEQAPRYRTVLASIENGETPAEIPEWAEQIMISGK